MSLSVERVRDLCAQPSADAWRVIAEEAWSVCSPCLGVDAGPEEVVARDRSLQPLDLFLSAAGWDLWRDLAEAVPSGASELVRWWESTPPGRAVLILDGLSLRELPWILGEAERRGFPLLSTRCVRAELPPDTGPYASALGLTGRSSLSNDGAGRRHGLRPARTESTDVPFEDCAAWIGAEVDWVMWHHWPDSSVHDMAPAGRGLAQLAREAAEKLRSDGFWRLVERLADGRRLVVTSDHGYAAAGLFDDAVEEQGKYLQALFKGGRHAPDGGTACPWLPPTDLALDSGAGRHRYALGRRRWRSPGGYPVLGHGGLTVLEVLVPCIEMEAR